MDVIKEKSRGSLIVISGPSGAGKGTVIKEFLNIWGGLCIKEKLTIRKYLLLSVQYLLLVWLLFMGQD